LRWLVIALGIVTAGVAGTLFVNLKSELSPIEDRGVILIRGSGPEGATLSYMARYSAQADTILSELPEVRSSLVINGLWQVTNFLAIGRLQDWSDRDRKQQDLTAEIAPKVRSIPGVLA